jgi:hypothetical protein
MICLAKTLVPSRLRRDVPSCPDGYTETSKESLVLVPSRICFELGFMFVYSLLS